MSKRGDTIETTTRAKSGHPPHPILYVFPSFFDFSPPCVFPLHLGMGSDLLCALLPSFILLVPADFPFTAAVNSSLASGSFHTHPPLSVLTFLYNIFVREQVYSCFHNFCELQNASFLFCLENTLHWVSDNTINKMKRLLRVV